VHVVLLLCLESQLSRDSKKNPPYRTMFFYAFFIKAANLAY